MRRQDVFNTLIFNLFGAPYVVERSDAPESGEPMPVADERQEPRGREDEAGRCGVDRAA